MHKYTDIHRSEEIIIIDVLEISFELIFLLRDKT